MLKNCHKLRDFAPTFDNDAVVLYVEFMRTDTLRDVLHQKHAIAERFVVADRKITVDLQLPLARRRRVHCNGRSQRAYTCIVYAYNSTVVIEHVALRTKEVLLHSDERRRFHVANEDLLAADVHAVDAVSDANAIVEHLQLVLTCTRTQIFII